jgi:transcriptional regulator with XRE-family HTH domain
MIGHLSAIWQKGTMVKADALTPLGRVIQAAQNKKNWNDTELASRSGLSAGTISRLKNGKRKGTNTRTLQALADALEIERDALDRAGGHASKRGAFSPAQSASIDASLMKLSPRDQELAKQMFQKSVDDQRLFRQFYIDYLRRLDEEETE